MVYRFRVFSDEIDRFERVIEVDSQALFIDLHNAVLDSVGYEKNDISSFFICDENWEREVEITLVEMAFNPEVDTWVMDSTHLDELIEDEGQKLMFVFDYLTERCFYMEMEKIITGKKLSAPVCVSSKGNAPQQHVDFEEFEKKAEQLAKKMSAKLDLDDDLYGDDEFDADELSEGGFNDDLDFGGGGGFMDNPFDSDF